jgi:tyrosine-protein phosphatase SIW14
MKRIRYWALGLLIVFSAAGTAHAEEALTEAMDAVECQNFDKVNDSLYRGGIPTRKDMENLKALGIRTIVDFHGKPRSNESVWAKELGMRYFSLPWGEDAYPVVDPFLKLVEDPENQPVFVHCYYGRTRTGAMIAAYKIKHERLSADDALKEMADYGFVAKRHPALVDFLHDYEKRLADQEA